MVTYRMRERNCGVLSLRGTLPERKEGKLLLWLTFLINFKQLIHKHLSSSGANCSSQYSCTSLKNATLSTFYLFIPFLKLHIILNRFFPQQQKSHFYIPSPPSLSQPLEDPILEVNTLIISESVKYLLD